MKENFEKNNNPFLPLGTIGRLGYFITNTLIVVISSILLYFLCPTGIATMYEPLLVNNYSQFSIMANNASKPETAIFVIIVLGIMALKFIVAKKRIMDIASNTPNIIRNSYLIAGGIALLPFMANFVVPVASGVNKFLLVTSIIISIYLIVTKGANQK